MNISKRLIALGGGMLLGVTGVANADAVNSNDVAARLAAAEARIAEMENRQDSNWLNERRAEEVKGLVREVLADADTRASLLQEGATAGHNGQRFFLASDDNQFLMNISGQIQARYVLNKQRGAVADRWQGGFELRRAKILVDGHVGSPHFTYALRAATHSGALTDIELATIGYKITDTTSLRVGRDKAPLMREELVSSSHQLAVERSLVNEYFSTRYVEGIYIDTTVMDDVVRLAGSINNGYRSAGTTFATPGPFGTDFAATGRVDVRLMGGWEQWNDFTSWQGAETSLLVGGGIHYQVSETGDAAPNFRGFIWTVDGSFKTGGLGLYGAIVGRHDTSGPFNVEEYGAVAQAGYLLGEKLEPFVRYEWIRSELTGRDHTNIGTIGANYYINGHAAKLTVDVVWAFDPIFAAPGLFGTEGHGLLPDAGSDDQIALRAQLQLLF
jgi:hypothetical protein